MSLLATMFTIKPQKQIKVIFKYYFQTKTEALCLWILQHKTKNYKIQKEKVD